MLDEQHGRLAGQDQLLDQDAGEHVDKVERLVPEVEMRGTGKAPRDEHLLLLASAVGFDRRFKLRAREIEFPEDRFQKAFVEALFPAELPERPAKERGVLGDIGDGEVSGDGKRPRMADRFAEDEL